MPEPISDRRRTGIRTIAGVDHDPRRLGDSQARVRLRILADSFTGAGREQDPALLIRILVNHGVPYDVAGEVSRQLPGDITTVLGERDRLVAIASGYTTWLKIKINTALWIATLATTLAIASIAHILGLPAGPSLILAAAVTLGVHAGVRARYSPDLPR